MDLHPATPTTHEPLPVDTPIACYRCGANYPYPMQPLSTIPNQPHPFPSYRQSTLPHPNATKPSWQRPPKGGLHSWWHSDRPPLSPLRQKTLLLTPVSLASAESCASRRLPTRCPFAACANSSISRIAALRHPAALVHKRTCVRERTDESACSNASAPIVNTTPLKTSARAEAGSCLPSQQPRHPYKEWVCGCVQRDENTL